MALDLLSGLAQGFVQGQQARLAQEEKKEQRKLKEKLFKRQLDMLDEQDLAKQKLFQLLSPALQQIPAADDEPAGQVKLPGKSLLDVLSDPEGQMLALQSGLMKPTDIKSFQQPDMATILQQFAGGGQPGIGQPAPGGFELTGFKLGPQGQFMPDFGRTEIKRWVTGPEGKELIGLDALGREVARRPASPAERAEEDKPLSPTELLKFRDSLGNPPQPGTTLRQAREKGFAPISTKEEDLEISQRGAGAVLTRLEDLVGQIFPDGDLWKRMKASPGLVQETFTQNDPNVALYQSLKDGTLAPIIRAMGEKGTLAEGDVQRAIKLMPKLLPIPDSKEVAMGKLKQIKDILSTAAGAEKKKPEKPSLKGPGKQDDAPIAVNPQTGERMILRNGKWQKL